MKKVVLAVIAVFVVWSVLDFIIHGLLLRSLYEQSAQFWRPEEEMRMGLMYTVTFLCSIFFVLVPFLYFKQIDLLTGLKYGALYGLGVGISMGYGTFSVMAIPYHLALGWFLGTLVETMAAGAVAGWILAPCSAPPEG